MMVLSQACQSLCYLSDRAALAAASLSAAWSHPKSPLSKKAGCPHRVRSSIESTSALSPQGGPCICVHGVPVLLILTGVHFAIWRPIVSGALQKRLSKSWGTPGSLGDSLPIAHTDFQCTVVCHLRMLAVFSLLPWILSSSEGRFSTLQKLPTLRPDKGLVFIL